MAGEMEMDYDQIAKLLLPVPSITKRVRERTSAAVDRAIKRINKMTIAEFKKCNEMQTSFINDNYSILHRIYLSFDRRHCSVLSNVSLTILDDDPGGESFDCVSIDMRGNDRDSAETAIISMYLFEATKRKYQDSRPYHYARDSEIDMISRCERHADRIMIHSNLDLDALSRVVSAYHARIEIDARGRESSHERFARVSGMKKRRGR